MDSVLEYARSHRRQIIDLIRRMVETESPSGDAEAIAGLARLIEREVSDLARVRRCRGGHLVLDFEVSKRRAPGRVLAHGHLDTVWPLGTLKQMAFRRSQGRLWGPGVLDMKSGVALFIFAMRALRDLDIQARKRVSMLLVTDEEIGSPTSRRLTEREAKKSDVVLVLEPGLGIEGKLKTARKGVGEFLVTVHGRAAHSGIDFTAGASAVLELGRQLERLAGFTDLKRGITVNPGVIEGGTRPNVVAARASAQVDLRFSRLKDGPRIERKFHGLKPIDKRCRLVVTGGVNRPPMERTAPIGRLFRLARKLAAEIGVELAESMTGGASDGNLTAALGIPTLDGLGGVGEGAHAPHESILVDRIADRTALLAKLTAAL